jgi:hypothetical protein
MLDIFDKDCSSRVGISSSERLTREESYIIAPSLDTWGACLTTVSASNETKKLISSRCEFIGDSLTLTVK